MHKCDIYLYVFHDNKYSFGYKLLIEEPMEYTRTMEILYHNCPAVSYFRNSKGNYDEIEEIAKIINSYEDVTVYYDSYSVYRIDSFKKLCKNAKFKRMNSGMIRKSFINN